MCVDDVRRYCQNAYVERQRPRLYPNPDRALTNLATCSRHTSCNECIPGIRQSRRQSSKVHSLNLRSSQAWRVTPHNGSYSYPKGVWSKWGEAVKRAGRLSGEAAREKLPRVVELLEKVCPPEPPPLSCREGQSRDECGGHCDLPSSRGGLCAAAAVWCFGASGRARLSCLLCTVAASVGKHWTDSQPISTASGAVTGLSGFLEIHEGNLPVRQGAPGARLVVEAVRLTESRTTAG